MIGILCIAVVTLAVLCGLIHPVLGIIVYFFGLLAMFNFQKDLRRFNVRRLLRSKSEA